jgi:hypothetical protein
MCRVGAVMSACGFIWCYLSFLALTAHHFQWLGEEQVLAALNLGYILLLPFILFGGYAITLDSWAKAFRRSGFLNYGAAAWNTYASIHDTYSAWRNMGGAFASLGNFFGGRRRSDKDSNGDGGGGILLVLLLVAFVLARVLTTPTIIRRVAATEPLPRQPSSK